MALPLLLLLLQTAQDTALAEYLAVSNDKVAERKLKRLIKKADAPMSEWKAAIQRTGPVESDPPEEIPLALPKKRKSHCLYLLPKSYDPKKPTPLVIVCHGMGGKPEHCRDLWMKTAATSDAIFAFPRLMHAGIGWRFRTDEREVPIEALREMKRRFNIDEDRIFLSGISKGAHCSWDVGLRYPHLFAGIVPECGRLYNHGLPLTPGFDYLENALNLSVFHLQGKQDHAPMVEAVREGCRLLKEKGGDVTYLEMEDRGHTASPDKYPDVLKWMGERTRERLPDRTIAVCHDVEYGRRAWSEITKFDTGVAKENGPLHLKRNYPKGIPEKVLKENEKRVFDSAAYLKVERTVDNKVTVVARNIKTFKLFISEEMFDLENPIRVIVNSKPVYDKPVKPSVETLLRRFRQDRDRTRLFVGVITIRVPK